MGTYSTEISTYLHKELGSRFRELSPKNYNLWRTENRKQKPRDTSWNLIPPTVNLILVNKTQNSKRVSNTQKRLIRGLPLQTPSH